MPVRPTQGYARTARLTHGCMEAPRQKNSFLPLLLILAASQLIFNLILRQRPTPGYTLYYVSIDPLGEIGWSSPTFVRPGCPDAHVIEVLIEDTPAAYRGYLHERGISYITCGRHALDCQLLAQKLYALFGVRTMLICGGGTLNWTFLEQNALDELSLLLAPAADGLPASPAVFQRSAFSQCDQAFSFRLKEVRQLDQDVIHLIYTIDPKKG